MPQQQPQLAGLVLLYSVRALTLWALSALPFVAATPADTIERNQERRRLGLWLRVAVDVALLALGILRSCLPPAR